MIPLRLAAPAALGLLVLLPLTLAAARHRRLPAALTALRLLALGLVIFSLAQPSVLRHSPGRTIMFAVDLSDSMRADAREVAMEFVRAAARKRSAGDRIGLITFGTDAVVEEAPSTNPRLLFSSHPSSESTDIAQAIRTALAAMPEGGERRIVLATDGNAHRGDLAAALAIAQSEGVEISVFPVMPASGTEVRIDEVRAPAEVRVGERFPVRVVIEATTSAQVQLQVMEGEATVDRRALAVQAGRAIVTYDRVAQHEGVLPYTASIAATPESIDVSNRASALVLVHGAPVVWYVAQQPGILARALAAQGLRIHHLASEALPATAAEYQGAAAVVLDDVPATQLAPAQMSALRDYVGQMGGGLIATGGLHSFGIGGYAGTPLEEALPVSMDVRHRLAIPSMAIILVIDASGSMGSYGQEIGPLELAKETAQAVIDLLGERDIIGAIAFDQQPRWLVPPTEARNREAVFAQIARLQAGGGTDMYPAIALAYDYLRQSPAKVRHAIVLSDGQTDPGDFQRLLTRMAREKMTVSTVAIGGDADVDLMRNVATWGAGRAYVAKDLYTIPQIFTAEALLASRVYIVEDLFTPQVVRDDLFQDVGRLPRLRGYVATSPKPASTLYLVSPQDDPILAGWQFGNGRAVAFTSDTLPRWALDWLSWPQFARFWSQLVRSVIRPEGGGLHVGVEREGAETVVVLDAQTAIGDPIDGLDVQGSAVARGRSLVVPLVQAAPGRYEGRVVLAEPGEYALTVTARRAGQLVGVRTVGVVVPYSPELRDITVNRGTLARIIEATGGHLLARAEDALRPSGHPAREATPAWPLFATAALGVFIAEIVMRRVPVLGDRMAGIVAALVTRWRRPPSAEEQAGDRDYAEADRWKLAQPTSPAASASMEAAARLYIARLKSTRESPTTQAEGPVDHPPPDDRGRPSDGGS